MLCTALGTGAVRNLSIHWTTAAPVPLPRLRAHEPPPAEQRVVMLDDGDMRPGRR